MCGSFVSVDSFFIVYYSDQYKNQKLCDKAVDGSLAALKLKVKRLKNFLLLCRQMKIYSILMKILVMSYFLVMK